MNEKAENKKYQEKLAEYRKQLVDYEQQIGSSYDKTLITLSGGALGISIVFIEKILSGKIIYKCLLFYSWLSFVLSLGSVLLSLYFCTLSYRKAIKQIDEQDTSAIGGWYSRVILFLNAAGVILFFVGLACIMMFAYQNIGGHNGK